MEASNIVGWIVFLIGVSLIGFAIHASYKVFTGEREVAQIFVYQEKTGAEYSQKGGIEGEIGKMVFEQIKDIFPMEDLYKFSNFGIWLMGAWILIFGGSQISNLGIKLIKQ